MATYTTEATHPYPAERERATAGRRGTLRLEVPVNEASDWSTLAVTGPTVERGSRGHACHQYTGIVEAH